MEYLLYEDIVVRLGTRKDEGRGPSLKDFVYMGKGYDFQI